MIDGMGHDIPAELFDTFTDVVRRTADRARGGVRREPESA